MAAVPPGQRRGRQPVPRLHLRGGLRHHPGRGGGSDPVRRLGRVARPVRHACSRRAMPTPPPSCACPRSPPSRWASWRSSWVSPSRSRTSPSWCAWPSPSLLPANFPVLFMSVLWKDCTTQGAVIGGFLGLGSRCGPDRRFGQRVGSRAAATRRAPPGSRTTRLPSSSMTAAFFTIWLVSILDNSAQAKKDLGLYLCASSGVSETGSGCLVGLLALN